MAKRKYPSELSSRTIRVNIGDWQWLNSLSRELGITVAQAFHKVITRQKLEPKPEPKPAQIPMPVFQVAALPVAQVTRPLAPAIRVAPVTTIATNGSKGAAFRIKPKGAVRHD